MTNTDPLLETIFISHSTKNRPGFGHDLLPILVGRLKAIGYEVIWDGDLRFGDRWRDRVNEFMSRADFGIILLDKNAVQSEEVRDEANYLWRRLDTRVIPVLANIDRPTIRARHPRFDFLLNLHNIEIFGDAAGDPGVTAKIDDLVAHIGEYDGRTKREIRLIKILATKLPVVDDVARQIFEEQFPKSRSKMVRGKEKLAGEMLDAKLGAEDQDLGKQLMRTIRALKAWSFPNGCASDVVEILEPTWIPFDHATDVLPHGLCHTAVLKTNKNETGRQYILRAIHPHVEDYLIPYSHVGDVPIGEENTYDATAEEVIDRLLLCNAPGEPKCEHDIAFVVVRAGHTESRRLKMAKALHGLCKRLVIVLLIETTVDLEHEDIAELPGYVLLPDIDEKREERAGWNIRRIREDLKVHGGAA
jgi:hypothetical protein